MKILLEYIHYPVCSGRWVREALDNHSDHEVYSMGVSTGRRIWNRTFPYEHTPRIPPVNWKPDLHIILDSAEQVLRQTICDTMYPATPRVIYGVDNHVRDYDTMRSIAHYFLAHNWPSLIDMKANSQYASWLPCGYSPDVFTPSDIPWSERQYDVSFMGMAYPGRIAGMRRLEESDLITYVGISTPEEMRDVYHDSRIGFNWSVNGDLSQRIFETLACGCALLTDAIPDMIWQEDIVSDLPGGWLFAERHTLLTNADMLLKRGSWSTSSDITKSLSAHTWMSRVQVILDWYGCLGSDKAFIPPFPV